MIEFRNLSKAYRTPYGHKMIVDGLTLTLPRARRSGCSAATAPASRRCSA